jgi:hypothetical protein
MDNPNFTIPQYKDLPIKEFGRVVTTTSIKLGDETQQAALAMAQQNADYFKSVMSYITDVRWVKEPETQLGPVVDALQRFRPIGWHALMASKGYEELSKYFEVEFACRKEHVPENITLKFIWQLVKRWASNV